MLKIRLQRTGKKNFPSYRIVLAEHTSPPQGKFQEILGFYNPLKKKKNFKKDRIEYWLSRGVQFSPTVYNLLVDEKIFAGSKLEAWKPKKKPKEEKLKEEKPKAPTPEGVGVPISPEASVGKEPKPEEKVEEKKEKKPEEKPKEEKPKEKEEK